MIQAESLVAVHTHTHTHGLLEKNKTINNTKKDSDET